MRKWRVGTLSMGVSLVLMGTVLFVSMWKGIAAFDTLIAWWPVAFILVGLEILFYVFTLRQENAVVYYDVFSILFVGFLFTACLGFAFLTSSGLLQEIRLAISETEETVELPVMQEAVNPAVKKIIVDAPNGAVTVDKTAVREVHVMGRYERVASAAEEASRSAAEDRTTPSLVSTHAVGDVMYVSLRSPAAKRGLNSHYPRLNLTVVVPQDVQVEVRDRY